MFKLLGLPKRGYIALLHDILASGFSFLLTLYIFLSDSFYELERADLLINTFIFIGLSAVSFLSFGLYKGVWRYASLNEVAAIVFATGFAILSFICVLFFTNRLGFYPRLSFLGNGFVMVCFLSAPRMLYRYLKDHNLFSFEGKKPKIPALIIGAGDNAELFIREMKRSHQLTYKIVGIIDTHGRRIGMTIRGIRVIGFVDDFEKIYASLLRQNNAPQHLILADDKFRGRGLLDLVQKAEHYGIPVSRVPKVTQLELGATEQEDVRPVVIEDLLGRPQNTLDRTKVEEFIKGRKVLVTGAGGSIGGELVRQICSYLPSHITLLDHSEYALYTIDLEVSEKYKEVERTAILADVRDYGRLKTIFQTEKPDIVFHAAALKHVPMVEAHPLEGMSTNVIGTRNVADLCRDFHVDSMVMISTDKVVNPTNIMGATKRMAEIYCQALDKELSQHQEKTRYVTVRFGNVLGSSGSVVPLFQRQLAAGGPLTLTHPDVIRYFMTIREAVELVLQAAAIGSSPKCDAGKIFVLDMGEPVRILDLAQQMILLAGLKPDEDIKIEYTGLRPGEKLFEELFHGNEELVSTAAEGVLLAAPRASDYALISRSLDELKAKCSEQNVEKAVAILKHMVPEYKPQQHETGDDVRKPA